MANGCVMCKPARYKMEHAKKKKEKMTYVISSPLYICVVIYVYIYICTHIHIQKGFYIYTVTSSLSHVRLLQPHGLQPARLLCPWDSPGKNIGVGCHFLLQYTYILERRGDFISIYLSIYLSIYIYIFCIYMGTEGVLYPHRKQWDEYI